MSDLFHEDVPTDFIIKVLSVIRRNKRHTFQILTKRSHRLLTIQAILMKDGLGWPDNAWVGVSVEDQLRTNRIYDLMQINAKVRWLSMEPLITPVWIDPFLHCINWVVVGGESGPKTKVRKMDLGWARDIQDQCLKKGVPFFYKQGGILNKCDHSEPFCRGAKGCNLLDGELVHQYPL